MVFLSPFTWMPSVLLAIGSIVAIDCSLATGSTVRSCCCPRRSTSTSVLCFLEATGADSDSDSTGAGRSLVTSTLAEQPVARAKAAINMNVVGVFKITNDLERVGDLAVNIAERAKESPGGEERRGMTEIDDMAGRVREMLNAALDSFLAQDDARARTILELDDRVDQLLRVVYQHQIEDVGSSASRFQPAVRMLSCAKYLERIADLATNIAEDVIYMVTGEIVKHLH